MQTSFNPPPLTPAERRQLLIMRRWRPEERQVVRRGMLGRATIAVEPAALAVLFAFFAVALVRSVNKEGVHEHSIFGLVFAIGAATFALYAIVLMIEPIRAMRETLKPIFIVDGYLRMRGRDDFSERGCNGYVAVLLEDKRVACEWPTKGEGDLPSVLRPALLEFSEYGGIHAVDGQPTGVLPNDFPVLGVGGNRPPWHLHR